MFLTGFVIHPLRFFFFSMKNPLAYHLTKLTLTHICIIHILPFQDYFSIFGKYLKVEGDIFGIFTPLKVPQSCSSVKLFYTVGMTNAFLSAAFHGCKAITAFRQIGL